MHRHDSSFPLETDARKFMREIEAWDGQSPSFRVCVMAAMLHLLLFHEKETLVETLADEFEVAPGTVYRWANGTIRPHLMVQRRVVAALHRELEIALTPAIAV